MLAEIIAIGDELTSGQRLDTNSQWLSQQLSDLGVTTVCHQTIADYREPMIQAFQLAARRADVILVTGGLGPTADDLTRDALAEAFGVSLVFHPPSWDWIQELFRKRSYRLPESNRVQAMFPDGAEVISNHTGTAPGIDWTLSAGEPSEPDQDDSDQPRKVKAQSRFFCLPGVPAEMKEMFVDHVVPAIRAWQGKQSVFICRRVIRTFGAGESHVESLLPDLIRRGNDPQVGITASKATISLRLEAKGESAQECQAKLDPVAAQIRETLGDLVFGEGEDELEDAVVPLLERTDHRLVVVEWGTAGLVSQKLQRVLQEKQNSESMFRYSGSVLLTNQQAVIDWLAPDVSKIGSDDVWMEPELRTAVEQLAEVAAQRFQATLSIASGPLPARQADDSNNPFVIVGRLQRQGQVEWFYRQFHVVGHTSIWQPRASKQVLNLLRLMLMGKAEATAP